MYGISQGNVEKEQSNECTVDKNDSKDVKAYVHRLRVPTGQIKNMYIAKGKGCEMYKNNVW